jgi:hypothetical protein
MAIGEVNMSSKRYTEEFKIEAVRQVVDRGYRVSFNPPMSPVETLTDVLSNFWQ